MAFLAAGHGFVAIGIVGAFLPVLPTTVFLILAASCYARASTRFHDRLLGHRIFGPMIRDWERHRAMSVRTKVVAISTIVLTFGVTIGFFLTTTWVRLVHVATALVLIGFIVAFRTRRA